MASTSGTHTLLSRVNCVERAAEVAKKSPPKIVPLTEEAKALPTHIINVTDPSKLNAQTPFFKCPPWAGLPVRACHLHCTRDGVPLPSLGLDRFPFYLFGRSPVCDYVLEHPSVSSIHAVLVFHREQECFVLMDLGSTNGVKLNGVRIEKKRPVPAPIGSSIQFGFSTRLYKVSLGPPPSSKRLREEREEREELKLAKAQTAVDALVAATSTSTTTNIAINAGNDNVTSATNLVKDSGFTCKTGVATESTETVKENPTGTAVVNTEKMQTVKPTPAVRHLYHVLIKHKDVRRPVSLAPRNKGDPITRSKADAVALAEAIRSRHGEKKQWSLEEFTAVVKDFSECGSAKRNGDLGIVESGTYTEKFDEVAFALDGGAVSSPVETELGVHLIYYYIDP
ncbi:peptidyl-prolyl cis-trans isomerase [Trypanosoma theileri]|uniref:Peptidyl-prolyl cis-trans isomerase n=1 Tax=Trypanosoma theileri TaxID=67003 RepID=A0A1X0NT63_9TRYP|nr:peptidyl-prolyl cis-trans isomerase [Trypanosoma theileri]ORC87907.1 peptidyl-prolyl cis-trans isomerase [Trypanosoma theileri]